MTEAADAKLPFWVRPIYCIPPLLGRVSGNVTYESYCTSGKLALLGLGNLPGIIPHNSMNVAQKSPTGFCRSAPRTKISGTLVCPGWHKDRDRPVQVLKEWRFRRAYGTEAIRDSSTTSLYGAP